jgi:predicted membrane-bound spermidine synthase
MSSDIVAHYQNSWSDIDVEAHWDGVANIYIEENNKVKTAHDQRFKETITHLNLKNNEKVLVISSRDCEANDYILKANQTAVVCNAEISQGLMDIAQKVRPYVKQTKIDTYSKLNFKDEGFDKIVNLETFRTC